MKVARPCSIKGCPRPVRTRGWCGTHYARWLRHGDTALKPPQLKRDMKCSIADCPDLVGRNGNLGWCQRHFNRWRRHGDPCYERLRPEPGSCAECDKPVRKRIWCNAHYKRWLKYGDPLGRPVRPSETERFLAKIDKNGPLSDWRPDLGPCWIWTAGKAKAGYGLFHPAGGGTVSAHRYSWEMHKSPIPDGLVIDHLCRVRKCVNPDHLEPVPGPENNRRGFSIATFNALKTHCPKNHEYTPENTYISPKGGRICRECARERDRQPHRRASVRRAKARAREAA